MTKQSKNTKAAHHLAPVCVAVLLVFGVQTVEANPLGGSVVNGQASFNSSGNILTVTNTPGTIIHWNDFSIQQNEITRFAQQSASSAVLNRVITNNPSQILGALQSNGRVFLVNPNGIVFGAGSSVDVAGMVATTLNLSNADFLAGRHNFTNPSPTGGGVGVSNAGNITAQSGGEIYLIAPNVQNSGVITAPNGEILLVAGNSVELVNSLDPNLRVNITAPAGDVTNVGQLVSNAGSLGLFGTIVKNSGTVSADSATLQGGKIVFKATQRVDAGGSISAQGVGGGEIKVLADMHSGTVNVTGALDASAPNRGNGGFIETSAAHVQVADTARVTTLAANGKNGTWLIDPQDFMIAATGGDITGATLSAQLDTTSVLIQSVNGAAVGNGDIWVNDAINMVGTVATTLTLQAVNDINLNANIISTGGALNVVLNADNDSSGVGVVNLGTTTISLNGGTISALASAGSSGVVNLAAGTATLNSAINVSTLNISGGTLNGIGSLTVTNSYNQTSGTLGNNFASIDITQTTGNLLLSNMGATGSVILTAITGAIIGNGAITAASLATNSVGGTTMNGANGVNSFDAINATGGNITFNNISASLNVTGLSNPAGDVAVTNSGSINSSGIIDASGAINITSTAGDLNQTSGSISNASGFTSAGLNDVTLGGANITLTAVQSQRNVVLNSTGNVNLIGVGSGGFIDDTSFVYNLPFAFNFFGTSYSQAWITTNGLVTFGTGTSSYTDSLVELGTYIAIAPAWNDWVLQANLGKDIRIGFGASDIRVSFDVTRCCATPSPTTQNAQFETVLNSNGVINFNYGAANFDFAGDVTIGISNGTGAAIASQLMSEPNFSMNNLRSTTFTPDGNGGYTETLSSGSTALSPMGAISGSAILNQGTGEVVTAAFGNLAINAGGLINAPTQITAQLLQFVSNGGASFTGTNHFGGITSAVNNGTGDIVIYNTASPFTLDSLANIGGNVLIDNMGGVVLNGALSSTGTFDLTAHSPITVNSSASISSNGNIMLTAVSSAANSTTDLLSITGTLSSTNGNIILGGGSGVDLAATSTVSALNGRITAASPFGLINVNGTVSAANIFGQGAGIAIGSSGSLTSSGLGDAIVLDAGSGNFVNNAGGNVLRNSGSGRWLVYSSDPALNTFGGLGSGNQALWNKTYSNYAGASVVESGNRYLFSLSPTYTVSASAALTKIYGTDLTLSAPVTSISLVDAASFGNVFLQDIATGTASLASAGFAANAPVQSSPYVVTVAAGSVVAPSGYGAATYRDGTLVITPARLTVTANNASKTYDGMAYSGGNGISYSGFVNGETYAVMSGALSYGGTSQGATNTGNYLITPRGLSSNNYAINFLDGTLTIVADTASSVTTATVDSMTNIVATIPTVSMIDTPPAEPVTVVADSGGASETGSTVAADEKEEQAEEASATGNATASTATTSTPKPLPICQ